MGAILAEDSARPQSPQGIRSAPRWIRSPPTLDQNSGCRALAILGLPCQSGSELPHWITILHGAPLRVALCGKIPHLCSARGEPPSLSLGAWPERSRGQRGGVRVLGPRRFGPFPSNSTTAMPPEFDGPDSDFSTWIRSWLIILPTIILPELPPPFPCPHSLVTLPPARAARTPTLRKSCPLQSFQSPIRLNDALL
jgi:hypothetical protein